MNDLEIKSVVSFFIKKNPEEISESSKINLGSVLTTRLYSELKKKGYFIKDGTYPKTYGELLLSLSPEEEYNLIDDKPQSISNYENPDDQNSRVGVDLESISNFKEVNDFRDDTFYKDVFSDREISYCVIQNNPLESFAGKYAAKEALIKIDNRMRKMPLNKLEILTNKEGKPCFPGYNISISHSNGFAIAVAVKISAKQRNGDDDLYPINTESNEIILSQKIFLSIKRIKIYIVILSLILFLVVVDILLYILKI